MAKARSKHITETIQEISFHIARLKEQYIKKYGIKKFKEEMEK